jgi:hypothetical protein
MNADKKRRVKFEAETNYNKGFRLTRRDCMGPRALWKVMSEEYSPRRHGEEQHRKKLTAEARRRGEDRNFAGSRRGYARPRINIGIGKLQGASGIWLTRNGSGADPSTSHEDLRVTEAPIFCSVRDGMSWVRDGTS